MVENRDSVSRKDLLDACGGVARLRPVWDEIASRYDAVVVPSAVDEAPVGLGYTGDAVSFLSFSFQVRWEGWADCLVRASIRCGLCFMRRR